VTSVRLGDLTLTLSMRTRSPALIDVSSRVWIPGNTEESNVPRGPMRPDVGRCWLPTWLPRVDERVADLTVRQATASGFGGD
jgi:hypothetical protein